MKKSVFQKRENNLLLHTVCGLITGAVLGAALGFIEGEIIYSSLRGFGNSLWMLFITPLLYGLIGGIYGAVIGILYYFFSPVLKPNPDYKAVHGLASAVLVSLVLIFSIVTANKSIIFPRFHPISLAADLIIIAAGYFLWKLLVVAFYYISKIKRGIVISITAFAVLLLLAYNIYIFKNLNGAKYLSQNHRPDLHRAPVIILMIDTLRVDHLSAYGYAEKVSPTIDRLAKNGMLFENHYSSSSWTIPSHFTMMTGVTSGAVRQEFSISEKSLTLTERLQMLGYRTACMSANPLLSEAVHFDQGFQLFDSSINTLNRINDLKIFELLSHIKIRRPIRGNKVKLLNPAELVTDYALDWLDSVSGDPFFLFINYMDVHDPYLPPKEYRTLFSFDYKGSFTGDICGDLSEAEFIKEKLPDMTEEDWRYVISQYDGAVKYVDDQIARIVKTLEKKNLLEDTILIITSDHGELFGEYGLATHHLMLSEEETHTPLIIHYPRVIKNPARVKTLSGIVDIYPTLKKLIGFAMPKDIFMEGTPLVTKKGEPAESAGYVALTLYENSYKASVLGPAFNRNLFCYRVPHLKYLYPELNEKINWSEVREDIFRREQIEERLYRVNKKGKLILQQNGTSEKLKTIRKLLKDWRKSIKDRKTPLGVKEESDKLLRSLSDHGYIRPN